VGAHFNKSPNKNHKACIEGIGIRERHLAASAVRPQAGKKQIHVGIDLSNLKKEGK